MTSSSVPLTTAVTQDSKSVSSEIKRLFEDSIFNLLSNPSRETSKEASPLQDLQEEKEKLEKELDEAKTALCGSCENVSRLTEEYESLKKKNEELTTHDQLISKKKAELEKEYSLLSNIKSNSQDREVVNKTKFHYKCVRNLTQVRFSYGLSDSYILDGFIFNKVTEKVSSFSINISKLDGDQVQERLMKLMKEVSHPSFADLPSE